MTSALQPSNAAPVTERKIENPRILLVVFDNSLSDQLNPYLVENGFDVTLIKNAAHAFRALQEKHFSTVIIDADLPAQSGFNLVRAVQKNPVFQSIPILLLATRIELIDIRRAMAMGVTELIAKPIDLELFADKINLSARRNLLSRQIHRTVPRQLKEQIKVTSFAEIESLSENEICILTHTPISSNQPIQLESGLFDSIGVRQPTFQWLSCEPVSGASDPATFRIRYALLGLHESELLKIKKWLNKLTILQKNGEI